MSGFRTSPIGNCNIRQRSTRPLLSNLSFRALSHQHLLTIRFSKETNIPEGVLIRAARAISPRKFTSEGAKKAAVYLSRCLGQASFDGLRCRKAFEVVGKRNVQLFISESGTRKYYTALIWHLPSNIREKILRKIIPNGQVRSILGECKSLDDLYLKGRRRLTKKRLKEAARAIDLSSIDSKGYFGAGEVARQIKKALKEGNLVAIRRTNMDRAMGNTQKVANFARAVIERTGYYDAIAALIEDRDVVRAILNACQINRDIEEILSMCGKGVMKKASKPRKASSAEIKRKVMETEIRKLLEWAEQEIKIAEVAERAKRLEATEKELVRLIWEYARVNYHVHKGGYVKLTRFCKIFGGSNDEAGWYLALKKVYGLSEEVIQQLKDHKPKDKRLISYEFMVGGINPDEFFE